MSDRADDLAATYVSAFANDEGTWGIDVHGTWFPCDDDSHEDVLALAADVRRGYAAALRAYAEEARQEEQERWLDYVALLNAELADLAPLAATHGWTSSRVEQGKDARRKLGFSTDDEYAAAIRAREGKG